MTLLRTLTTALALVCVSYTASAEPIPPDVLEKDRANCAQSLSGRTGGNAFCLCFVMAYSEKASLQRYLSIESEMVAMVRGGITPAAASSGFAEIESSKRQCARHLR